MDLPGIWKSVLAEIELSVSKATFQTHFAQSTLVSLVDGVATIGFANPLMRAMVEVRYYSLIKSVLDHRAGGNTSLVFVVIPRPDSATAKNAGPLFTPALEEPPFNTAALIRRLRLLPEYTFDNFAVSTSNQIAYAAATAVSKSPGSAYNPMFIHGGAGWGTTHLMPAIANSVLSKKPAARIVYCMGEEFLNEIIEAIQTKSVRLFKQKYRSAQLLLVDDVQFIAGKQTAQEEFFHTFNAIHR